MRGRIFAGLRLEIEQVFKTAYIQSGSRGLRSSEVLSAGSSTLEVGGARTLSAVKLSFPRSP